MQVTIPYVRRPQQRAMHESRTRFTVLVCHRRWGKTVWAINDLLRDALTKDCTGTTAYRGAYIAPLLKQAKRVAWDYCKHYAGVIPGVTFNESELRVDLPNGARIYLLGADNPDAIRGIYLDGCIMDEVAQMPRSIWGETIRPLLADRTGWAVFLGTPKGHNFFWELHQRGMSGDSEWSTRTFKASDTGILAEDELASARRDMTDEEYEQEFECSFTAAIIGAYYGKLLAEADAAGRIGNVPHDPALRVDTFWDLGIRDATAIWFVQRAHKEIRFIDHAEYTGLGLDQIIIDLQARKYIYGEHWAPHDIRVRELGSGKSRLEFARELGVRFNVAPQVSVMDGINAARMMLPRCWFDATRCRDGLEALRQYRADYDDKRQVQRANPLHDWTSHSADSFRYCAVSWRTQDIHDRLSHGRQQAITEYDVLAGVPSATAVTEYNLFGG